MSKYSWIAVLLFTMSSISTSVAQERYKYFDLDPKDQKVENSLYSSIQFLDSREDTSSFGMVRVGSLDKEATVLPSVNFGTQLSQLLTKVNGSNTQQKELMFQLRRLKFVEKAEGPKEFGYCFFRANLFTKEDGKFKQVSAIDTFIVVESAGDVTKSITGEANKCIVEFITKALKKEVLQVSTLTLEEIVKIDSIEKLKIKAYNVEEYVDGIYCNFEAFKNQMPNYTLFSITFEDGEIAEIKSKSRNGKGKKMKSDNVYAIVNKGKPYISAEFGYYPLVKNNNDFYFIGDDKLNFIKGQVVKSNSIFSSTEYVYSPLPLTSVFEIKIDHMNGKFMRVKEIK